MKERAKENLAKKEGISPVETDINPDLICCLPILIKPARPCKCRPIHATTKRNNTLLCLARFYRLKFLLARDFIKKL